ncbi:MAG: single-stranded DNA-binding protein [Clostridia bacterium]|nr:single-stranded DNA-binding protein [Clostridia bacterium]
MLNKVMLIGRLGRDPERKTTQSGKSVCTFTLATDTGYGDNKKTDWHNITVFDKTADNCAKYLHKGSPAYVEGRIAYDSYEKDGIKHTTTKIIANTVLFIATSKVNAQAPTNGAPSTGYQPPMSDDTFEGYPLDDEIPF